ncbi:flagellar brake protein [Gilvimarinus xylanilyticus]|uniref:Flagellar brake protein n=1 Tax=Gilvimarinus xylanilyticus TaxID=2944139 RepID=A0A9X2KTV3_9GAMM|nr:flagellar brake protein [Gilvimarinus xylanilyticus]MCP8900266.1 flagellar brake protein [Gilvimarinus xylanilyticus]
MIFEELRLPAGAALQLQLSNSNGQPERYSCRYVGAVANRSLLFTVPRSGGKLVRFRPGQRLAVRLIVENGFGLFAATVESVISEPYALLCVSYPDTVSFKGIRGATRVTVNQATDATNTSALSDTQASGHIADISITGARLELSEPIAEIGDGLKLEAQVSIEGQTWPLAIDCVVRSRVERSTQEQTQGLPAVYGVEFTERDKQALLTLQAYVFSHIVAQQSPQS